jgi:hypothetical protein
MKALKLILAMAAVVAAYAILGTKARLQGYVGRHREAALTWLRLDRLIGWLDAQVKAAE